MGTFSPRLKKVLDRLITPLTSYSSPPFSNTFIVFQRWRSENLKLCIAYRERAMALRAFASQAATALRISSRPVLLRHFSSKFPKDLKYAKSHEWFKAEGKQGTMGLTSFAVEELGDVVFVELPEVGSKCKQGDSICTVESVKASSSVYAPVGGEVVEVNTSLKDAPENLNKDPFGDSWLVKLKLADPSHLDSLLSAPDYEVVVETSKH